MNAGTTQIPVGTQVRVTHVAGNDPDDQELAGRIGEITHPFRGLMWPGETYVAGLRLPGDVRVNLTAADRFELVELEA